MATQLVSRVQESTTVNELLEQKLKRFDRLKESVKELESLKKELKELFEGSEEVLVGAFKVTGGWVEQPEKRIPPCRYWNMRVKRV